MLSLNETLQIIENSIAGIRCNRQPQSLYAPIDYILEAGGKRIRPALTLLACNLFSDEVGPAISPALGIEVFHNFTLLHDDLMDQADKRRNRPTVHKVWNENTAILSGDAMMIRAYQLVAQCPESYLKTVIDLFSATSLEICEGQQYDMEFETRMDVSEEEYMEMIRLKTAVLLACSLKTGAIVGGANEADATALYNFGIHIGLAFQLQDDLLDVYGDPQTFGKNIGGDILCNKKTFLLINALNIASAQQKEQLTAWITRTDFNPQEKIAAVTSLYNEINVRHITEKRIESLFQKGMEALNTLSVDSDKCNILRHVANTLMNRKA